MGYYFRPSNAVRIMGGKKAIFGSIALFVYLVQFVLTVGAITHYSSFNRTMLCNGLVGDEASEVYDGVLVLSSIFHIIEWARATVFLCAILMGVNLIQLYYLLGLNVFYGFAVFIIAITKVTGSDQDCKDNQETRYMFLLADIIVFFATFWFFEYPNLVLFPILGKKRLEEAMKDPDEDDENEGEDDKKEEEKKE